jgi:hypothetical protein
MHKSIDCSAVRPVKRFSIRCRSRHRCISPRSDGVRTITHGASAGVRSTRCPSVCRDFSFENRFAVSDSIARPGILR